MTLEPLLAYGLGMLNASAPGPKLCLLSETQEESTAVSLGLERPRS